MKLIIDIPEEVKNRLCFGVTYPKDVQVVCEALKDGISLDELRAEIEKYNRLPNHYPIDMIGIGTMLQIIDKYGIEEEGDKK